MSRTGTPFIVARPTWVMDGYQVRVVSGECIGKDGHEYFGMTDDEVKRTLRGYLHKDTVKISLYFEKVVEGVKHRASVIVRLNDAGNIASKEFSFFTVPDFLPRHAASGENSYVDEVDESLSSEEILKFMLYADLLLAF